MRFSISKPLVWLGIAVLGYVGCTKLMWSTVYTSESRDGKYTIVVQDGIHIGPDSPVRIILKRGLWSKTLAWRSDCWFSFAHAIWQGPTVGVVAEGRVCGQIRTAYNVRDGVSVPFSTIEKAIQNSIVKEYSVTDAELAEVHGNALLWVANDHLNKNRAATEFHRRYRRTR